MIKHLSLFNLLLLILSVVMSSCVQNVDNNNRQKFANVQQKEFDNMLAMNVKKYYHFVLRVASQILVNIDTLCPPFVVETATLLDVNGNQSDHCHHQHGDEPGKLSQSDGEADETYERHTDGRCCQCQKTAAYAHELQRFLQAFENGITLLIHRHNSG